MQQLKAKNHGLSTQLDALVMDHERLASLLSTVEKVMLTPHGGFVRIVMTVRAVNRTGQDRPVDLEIVHTEIILSCPVPISYGQDHTLYGPAMISKFKA